MAQPVDPGRRSNSGPESGPQPDPDAQPAPDAASHPGPADASADGTMHLVEEAREAAPEDASWYPLRTKVVQILEPYFKAQRVPDDYQLSDLLCGVCYRMEKSLSQTPFPDRKAFRAWLNKLAEHEIRDAWRRVLAKKRGGGRTRVQPTKSGFDPLEQLPTEDVSPTTAARLQEILELEQAAVDGLEEKMQQVYLLRRQNYSYADIATQLSHPATRAGLAQLRYLHFNACKKVQEHMLEKLDGYDSILGRLL